MNAKSDTPSTGYSLPKISLMVMLGAIALMQLLLIWQHQINWDEFYNLDKTYKMHRGDITNPLQTIFVRAFDWVRHIPGNEIDKIISARMLMAGIGVITCTAIYKIARRYYSVNAALFAVLSYVGFSFVFRNIFSFRHDGVLTMLLMLALYVVSDDNQTSRKLLIAGFLIGLAGMVSMKAVFFLPTIAIILLSRWIETGWSRKRFLEGFALAFMSVVSFLGLYLIHGAMLPETSDGIGYVSGAYNSLGASSAFFPDLTAFLNAIMQNFLFWILVLGGVFAIANDIRKKTGKERWQSVRILSFLIPILWVIVYRHSYEYFYVFLLAPCVILVATSIDRYFPPKRNFILALLAVNFGATSVVHFKSGMEYKQTYQDNIIDIVQDVFPEPVSYIDMCGMISSYPRINNIPVFMNTVTWHQKTYWDGGKPIMPDVLKTHQPKFLIANTTGLDLEKRDEHELVMDLFPADSDFLNANYVRYWGPIYIPGKQFEKVIPNVDTPFEILIDGNYTLFANVAIALDGKTLNPGSVVKLEMGTHSIVSPLTQDVVFEWGDNLAKPSIPEPDQMVFHKY